MNKIELADLNEMFKKPFITSYGFIRLLFAKLALLEQQNISKDTLIKKIYNLNQKEKYKKLLTYIGFKVSIDSIISNEIELCISWLESSGMIKSINQDIIIFIDENIANNILNGYEKDVLLIMDDFMMEFVHI